VETLITLSLLLNIVVLIPVCSGLLTNAGWVTTAYGEPSEARSILLSVYVSIALCQLFFWSLVTRNWSQHSC